MFVASNPLKWVNRSKTDSNTDSNTDINIDTKTDNKNNADLFLSRRERELKEQEITTAEKIDTMDKMFLQQNYHAVAEAFDRIGQVVKNTLPFETLRKGIISLAKTKGILHVKDRR
jgi:hypothetical protein